MPERTDLPPVLETFGTELRTAMHEAEARDAGRGGVREGRVARLARALLRSPTGGALSQFNDRALRDRVREHGVELAKVGRPASKLRRRPRPRVLAGTTAGLAAAGTVLALVLGAASSSPAFAVTRQADGTVTVTIEQLAGITGANAKLAALGVRARAVPVVAGCTASALVEGLVPRGKSVSAQTPGSHGARAVVSVRIDPSNIPAGQTLVLAARGGSHRDVTLLAEELVRGRVPACLGAALPPPAPTPIPGSCRVVHNTPVPGRHTPKPPSVAGAVQLSGEPPRSRATAGKHGRSSRPGDRGARSTACRVPPPVARHGGNSGSQGKTRK